MLVCELYFVCFPRASPPLVCSKWNAGELASLANSRNLHANKRYADMTAFLFEYIYMCVYVYVSLRRERVAERKLVLNWQPAPVDVELLCHYCSCCRSRS